MLVYVVYVNDYDACGADAIFSSEALARAYIATRSDGELLEIDEFELDKSNQWGLPLRKAIK